MENIMNKPWEKMTKKELLSLPVRPWGIDDKTKYLWVCLVNTKKKHDSGYNLFVVIGFKKDGAEIAGYMDDFRYEMLPKNSKPYLDLAIDCSMHGVFRIHTNNHYICVGSNTSTTFFEISDEKV